MNNTVHLVLTHNGNAEIQDTANKLIGYITGFHFADVATAWEPINANTWGYCVAVDDAMKANVIDIIQGTLPTELSDAGVTKQQVNAVKQASQFGYIESPSDTSMYDSIINGQ